MSSGLLLAQVPVLGAAFLTVRWCGAARFRSWSERLFALALSFGVAAGLGSVSYFFLGLCLIGGRHDLVVAADLAVCLAVAVLLAFLCRWSPPEARIEPLQSANPSPILSAVLCAVLLFACGCAAYHIYCRGQAFPHGSWDAWAIWNSRARMLFRGEDHWEAAFDSHIQTHLDYPLLLPANVARLWTYAGSDDLLTPRWFAALFTFAVVGVVVGGLARVRTVSQGLLAGLVLLSGDFLTDHGVMQYADVPLAFYIVAALALLCLHNRGSASWRLLILAGVLAGLTAWTKNEGAVLALCLVAAYFLTVGPTHGWHRAVVRLGLVGLGLLPIVLGLVYFKTHFASYNDVICEQGNWASVWGRLSDGNRYSLILESVGNQFREIGGGRAAVLISTAVLLGVRWSRGVLREAALPVVFTAFAGAAYFGIYVLTPHDLSWHLSTSLDRLLLQMYPAALFGLFVALQSPEELLARARGKGSPDSTFYAEGRAVVSQAA